VIFVGKDKALVIEAKGWRQVKKIGNSVVEADRELHEDPCYQLNNYVNKLNLFHSVSIKENLQVNRHKQFTVTKSHQSYPIQLLQPTWR
jgi:hypothetical protein